MKRARVLVLALAGCAPAAPQVASTPQESASDARLPLLLAAPACTAEELAGTMHRVTPLFGRVVPDDLGLRVSTAWLDAVYAAVAGRVEPDTGVEGASARIRFSVRPDGEVKDLSLLAEAGPERVAHHALEAVRAARLTRGIPAPPPDVGRRDVGLVLEVRDGAPAPGWHQYPSRLAVCDSSATRPKGCASKSISRPAMMARGNTTPAYPPFMRSLGMSSTVLIRFVVDVDGRANPASIVPVEYGNIDFLQAVLSHLPRMQYLPAMIGECRAPMWVQQPFQFSIPRREPVPGTIPLRPDAGRVRPPA